MPAANYADRLGELLTVADASETADAMADAGHQSLPPESDVSFRDNMRKPDNTDDIVTADMRTANLSLLEQMVVKKVGIFSTWLHSFKSDYNLQNDAHLEYLQTELKDDMRVILNLSVAKGGWLSNMLINPRKSFSFLTGSTPKPGPLQSSREAGR